MHGAQQMQVCIEKLSNMHIGLLPITPQDAQKKKIYAVYSQKQCMVIQSKSILMTKL